MIDDSTTLALAAGMGAVAGMRSMAAPALASRHLSQRQGSSPLRVSPRASGVLGLLAAGEMIGDKTPFIPDRTDLPSVIGRAVSGGATAAALADARGGSALVAALVGSTAAVGSTFLSYYLRKKAGEVSGLPDPVLGLAEDAFVLTAGSRIAAAAG